MRDSFQRIMRNCPDYLGEYVQQIAKPLEENGFWDKEKENWARALHWNGHEWTKKGSEIHDWKYSLELQEGALVSSLIKKNKYLDRQISKELDYINDFLKKNKVISPKNFEKYCYGVLLSVLALGYIKYHQSKKNLAQECYRNMDMIYLLIKRKWPKATTEDESSSILKGLSHMVKAQNIAGEQSNETIMEIKEYTDKFLKNRSRKGYWKNKVNVSKYLLRVIYRRYKDLFALQEMEKRNIALMLAYDTLSDQNILTSVQKNIDYILKTRLRKDGGLIWDKEGHKNNHLFFECHQMWMLIVLKMFEQRSNKIYTKERELIWNFLTKTNPSKTDLFQKNFEENGAFFWFRNITHKGEIQTDSFKGAYEVGAAIWAMTLNLDIIKK